MSKPLIVEPGDVPPKTMPELRKPLIEPPAASVTTLTAGPIVRPSDVALVALPSSVMAAAAVTLPALLIARPANAFKPPTVPTKSTSHVPPAMASG